MLGETNSGEVWGVVWALAAALGVVWALSDCSWTRQNILAPPPSTTKRKPVDRISWSVVTIYKRADRYRGLFRSVYIVSPLNE